MIHYQATMRHDEATLRALARKKYDLFGKKNLVARTLISLASLGAGMVYFNRWWGVLLILYGSYIHSSKYAAADHTAKKLTNGIKQAGLEFPSSRYLFRDNEMEVITLPENITLGDPLMYDAVVRVAEDGDYFYLFQNEQGGYMFPKAEVNEDEDAFRLFIEEKTGKTFEIQTIPLVRLIRYASKNQEKRKIKNHQDKGVDGHG